MKPAEERLPGDQLGYRLGNKCLMHIADNGVFVGRGQEEVFLPWPEAEQMVGILAGYLEDMRRRDSEHEAEAFPPEADITW